MKIEIQSRHFSLGDEQREVMTEKLERLERFSPRPPVAARLTISREKDNFTADLLLALKSSDFRSRNDAPEPEFAVEAVVENIVTQLKRYKGKVSSRQKGEEGGLGRADAPDAEGLLETAGSVLKSDGFRLRSLDVDQALEAFRDSEHPFFVFRNVDSSRVNVVYRRDNGEMGLLESLDS